MDGFVGVVAVNSFDSISEQRFCFVGELLLYREL